MKKAVKILGSLVLLAAAAAGLAWWMSQATPTWYAPPDPVDPEVAELADRVEYRLVEEAQRIRPPEDSWTLIVREGQVNAWLSARLPRWIAHEADLEWPAGLGTPQVRLRDDGIHLALPWMDERGRERYPVLRFQPRLTAGGRLAVPLAGAAVGRLPLPDTAVRELVGQIASALEQPGSTASEETAIIAAVLAGEEEVDSTFKLADGRRVQVTAVALSQGAVHLTCRTLPEQ